MTAAQETVLTALKQFDERRFRAACERWDDPYMAAASLYTTDEAIHRAVRHANVGPDAWMHCLPIEAKRLLRELGKIVY